MFIGQRLKLARQAAELSLRELAGKVQMSAQAISKYERGLDVPSSAVLLRLAKALNVKTEYFFRPDAAIEIVPAYRKRSGLGKKEESAILARVREWLERYLELESLLPPDELLTFSLPAGIDTTVASLDEAERVADELRTAWGLGLDPIDNLMQVLEDRGIKIGLVDAGSEFDACTFTADGHYIMAVRRDLPGDRQRFDLAHELGHLILKPNPDLDAESVACRFAGAFLVPAAAARRELGRHRHQIALAELHLVKHKYGLSMQGWVYRAKDLGIIRKGLASHLFAEFRRAGWHLVEPGKQIPPEEPRRLLQMALRTLAEGLISESRVAELLGVSLAEVPMVGHGGQFHVQMRSGD